MKICSYNCKNIKTSSLAINKLFKNHQIILVQEHWLFQFQIQLLGEIAEDKFFVGKGVDLNDTIQPVQLPRGHGGVAILWDKSIGNLSHLFLMAEKEYIALNLKTIITQNQY